MPNADSGVEKLARGSIRGISFDYGHVLGGLDFAELARRVGLPSSEASSFTPHLGLAYRAHDEVVGLGEGHEAGWRALMAHLVGPVAGISGAPLDALVEELWRAQPTRNLWRHVPDEARRLLVDLRAQNVSMVITSNSEGRVRELLAECEISSFFREILDSGVLGFAKPDARIFTLAAKALDVPFDAMLHVGDSESADIVGAKGCGARAFRFDAFVPHAASRPTIADARLDDFAQLRAALAHVLGVTL